MSRNQVSPQGIDLIRSYGYPKGAKLESPLEMEQVTFVASPNTLRRLAAFLSHVADLMERHGDQLGHEHYSDFAGIDAPQHVDVIVTSAQP